MSHLSANPTNTPAALAVPLALPSTESLHLREENEPRGRTEERPARSPFSTHLKFTGCDSFYAVLRSRVDHYFESTGRKRRDCPEMYVKTAFMLGWFAASYCLLIFVAGSWWSVLALALSLGFSMAGVGFSIQHDAGHHAYSSRGWVNRLMAMTLDLLGGSSYVWARKHNVIHHSYTNVAGHDNDLDIGFFGRLSPEQTRLPFHRFQHFYLWALYGLLPMKWQLYDDFKEVITGRIGNHRLPRPRGWDLAVLIGGKAAFFSLALVIPLLLHPAWIVLAVYTSASFVQGLALSIVFQLAHCVEEASFPVPLHDTHQIETSWAVHQVSTTVNFARRNWLLSWLIGGLNYQVEHHLFHQICHVHYPALAKLVEDTCAEFKLRYLTHETFFSGVASHFRWLRQMGRPVAERAV